LFATILVTLFFPALSGEVKIVSSKYYLCCGNPDFITISVQMLPLWKNPLDQDGENTGLSIRVFARPEPLMQHRKSTR
jgi:hypothetical protein